MVDDHYSHWLWRKYVNAICRESKLSRDRQAMPASEDMRLDVQGNRSSSSSCQQSIAGPLAAFAVFCSGVAFLADCITSNGRIARSRLVSSTTCFAKSIAESFRAKSIGRRRNGPIE